MTTIKNIYDFIDKMAPFDTALSFDNVGLLIGNNDIAVSKVLLALDITDNVCEEAINLGAELIISHHPIIFKPIKNINFDSTVAKLIKGNISAICAHTNLDIAEIGVNFQLAKNLQLSEAETLAFEEGKPLGLIGKLPQEMTPSEFASFVKANLNCNGLRYTKTNDGINRVAVCSGSGGSFIEQAHEHSADAFVTGEIKHSDILKANKLGIPIFDVGHYRSENVIIEPLKHMLSEQFCDIEFQCSNTFTDSIIYI